MSNDKQRRNRSGLIVEMRELPRYNSERMVALRHALRLSQPQFATLLGVSLQAVKAWETARNPIPVSLQRLLFLFEAEPANLDRLCRLRQT